MRGVGMLVLSLAVTTVAADGFGQAEESEQEPVRLRLVSTKWPPYTDGSDKPRLAIELVHRALKRSGHEPVSEIRAPGTLMTALESDDLDGTAAVWKSVKRARVLRFSIAYLQNRLVLVGRKGSDVTPASLRELSGKRLAVVDGYAYGKDLEARPGPTIVRGKSNEGNLRALLSGTVDYMLADELVVHRAFERRPADAARLLAVGSKPLIERSLHFAVKRSRPDGAQIIQRFNAAIREMLADGSYNEILQIDWIMADVDEDGRAEMIATSEAVGRAPPVRAYDVGPSRQTQGNLQRQYVVGGRVYDRWEDVPDEYKKPVEREKRTEMTDVSLFRF